ncbi:MAG: group II intron reverse transcriptase/maturase [Bacteroidaceae bacterium]|nr:group II intron reverse transcriptase/maturase [Bacteroidaceae bacterium]
MKQKLKIKKKTENSAKPFVIDKHWVWEAYKAVKRNKGCAGVDKIDFKRFDKRVQDNLYRLWNRMSSGSYMPEPVLQVEIPKSNGGKRPLGIPTILDRIAQMVVVMQITLRLEAIFHDDSYGYRPAKSAHDAVKAARERCFKYEWVLDMDISKFFDTIDHELLMKAVEWKVQERWILLYIGRWLKVPYQTKDGQLIERTMGVPQGSVIGPVLANLFLHCVFDKWMETNNPEVPFERYADDTICHLRTREEAEHMKEVIMQRFAECKLTLNDDKTKIVHCEDSNRREGGEGCENSFDYLGYEFRPRAARNSKTGQVFTAFTPAMSKKAVKERFSSGYRPVHTAPSPRALAARRIFSVAAEQSCTQKACMGPCSALSMLPHTTMASAAFLSIPPRGPLPASSASFSLLLITTKCQGCLLTAVGAAMPARSIVSMSAFETGSSVYCRMLVRVMMFLIASFEQFSHCADTLSTYIANNRLMVIIFFIYLLL